ncbi:hypothetical protein P301_E11711 [Saccharomyces cerevisiae P301]|uniref:Putative uncharacterized protein YER137W-A n=2 Tax=Saccharomyces cerevisiae TaxID=4932 RepID=YE137_YEAST|nr:RecName: Full=Putative uncharacterized protein YER137W-A; Flags: Precursor [Saccharomyces cerevisiae S288C]AHX39282.1 hypothetical protein YER137W-A [Saccharomyces cerevisiae]EWG86635.1 hypothetical protein R008_E11726 [Saccharomyces cerevisiae R008]EWG91525.1 hypothetical protein P301_E11711 [Saccharomyces cerevisiae P301]WNV72575.1 hypothetical protein O6U65_0891 [Saccharomyces cerevisiae synthetic construct]CAY79324.1 EC1118_1E8_2784p [Saccharomyces cerevisiae EC1118]
MISIPFRSTMSRTLVFIILPTVLSCNPSSRLMNFSNSFNLCSYSTCNCDPSFCFEMINLARTSIACDNLTISFSVLFDDSHIPCYNNPRYSFNKLTMTILY